MATQKKLSSKNSKDSNSNDPTPYWIWLILGCMLMALFASVLLTEAVKVKTCTNELLTQGVTTAADVIDLKKNRKGQWALNLEFKNQEGNVIQGKRVAFDNIIITPENPKNPEKPKHVNVVYSKVSDRCWEITKKSGRIPLAERGLIFLLNMTFGVLLALVALICFVICVPKLVRIYRFKKV